MRFYDPDSGVIRIDGQEIRTAARRSVRGSYAMVLRDRDVVEQGTHRQLMDRNGFCHQLYAAQFE